MIAILSGINRLVKPSNPREILKKSFPCENRVNEFCCLCEKALLKKVV